nr:unnamed protein product [Callosobruchus analis]
MYEVRKDYPFYMPLVVFKYFWFFDLNPDKRHLSASDVGKIILLLTLFIIHTILPTLHLVKVAIAYDDTSLSDDITTVMGGVGFVLICYKTMYNNQHFARVFRDLAETERFGRPTTFDADVKYCRVLSTVLLFYTCVSYANILIRPY